jgi:hypothetical protein
MNNINPKSKSMRLILVVVVAAITAAPGLAGAVEMQAQFNAGVGYSDNLARTNTDQISESMRTVGLNFALQQNSRKVNAEIRAIVDYLSYAGDSFDSEVLGGVVANADYAFV